MMFIKVICSFLSVIICFLSTNFGIWQEQVKSVQSITKVDNGFYLMDYTYDYDIDEIMENGISTHIELIASGLAHALLDLKGFGCTTFNSVTSNGEYLLSRNFDYMDSPYLLIRTTPENGYTSISSVSLYFFGYSDSFLPEDEITSTLTLLAPYAPLDGINEKGLSVGVLELEKSPVFEITERPNLTTTAMIRAVLDKAATVDEAIKIFESYDMRDYVFGGCTYHYHIADANGNSAVIEFVNNKVNVIYPEKSNNAVDYIVAANYYLTEGVDDPDGMGQDRAETAYNALNSSKGITSEKQAMNILKSTSMRDADLHGYICSTLWSNVYNMNKKTVNICYNGNYDKTYTFSVAEPLTK